MAGLQELRYRTLNGVSPQGKPRVYLCCHPDDFAQLFEQVADEVLEAQATAAVWYRDPADGQGAELDDLDNQALLDSLAQMQLFVIPVTSRFLGEECRARTVELPFALAHHIPVLPILEEPGLASIFDRICGDLQCLDRHAPETDPTALPYKQRLREFVNQVLVGSQVTARIREAFDASLFLSYRKKDRAHAQQVMARIHEVPALRDVAIWYDEFLVPGEGFNGAIHDALTSSTAVVLVVTPNLLEDPNYVMTTEYPEARACEKPVVPIEVVSTDAGALSLRYPAIGEPVPADDGTALAANLVQALSGTVLGQRVGDPEHDYLIGLSYLMGIDMEVNRERGLHLIAAAAEAGNIEALERLVSMYLLGDGVEPNQRQAIAWQERLVEELRRQSDEHPTIEGLKALYSAYRNLGDYRRDIRDFAGARVAYSPMTDCAAKLWAAGDPSAKYRMAMAYASLGIVVGLEDNLRDARTLHTMAIQVLEGLVNEGADIDARRILVAEYGNLATVLGREGAGAPKREHAERAVTHARELFEETGRIEDHRLYATACVQLAKAYRDEGRQDEARSWYELGCSAWKAIVGESAQQRDWENWASALEGMGDVHLQQRRLVEARDCYDQAARLLWDLSERTEAVSTRYVFARSIWGIAEVCHVEEDLTEAFEWYKTAAGLLATLARDTHADAETGDYGLVCSNTGDIAMERGEYAEAEEWFRRYADAFELLTSRRNMASDQQHLARAYSKRGDTHFDRHDCESARPWFLKAYQIRRQLVDEEETEERLRELALSTIRLAKTNQNSGDNEGARFWYDQTLIIKRGIARMTKALEDWEALMLAYDDLARIEGIPDSDRRTYLKGVVNLATQLYQATGSDQHAAYLIYAKEQLADPS